MAKLPSVKRTPTNAGLLALQNTLEARLRTLRSERLAARTADEAVADQSDATLPELLAATDGIAIAFDAALGPDREASLHTKVLAHLPGWELRNDGLERVGFRGVMALPPPDAVPTIGCAWDLARDLERSIADVRSAVPLFAQLAPELNGEPDLLALAAASAANWHLDSLRVPAAWEQLEALGRRPGEGVVVAVVDTGYTEHPEIKDSLTRQPDGAVHGIDLLDGADPRDPLQRGFWFPNPSHGTSVKSVIASPVGPPAGVPPAEPFVTGVAPAAQVLPVRMTTSVVLLVPNKLTPAFNEAVKAGADVINVSLGLPDYWEGLHAAVRNAVDQGIIIVAASGNVWPAVVYPAAFPEVLAAAACSENLSPWRWASAGPAVDVLAPGVDVQRAFAKLRRQPADTEYGVEPSTGTTYAAACCSGLAALWLARHGGRKELIKHYGGDGRRVAQAFHYLIRTTARPAVLAPKTRYGEGIPDADALLKQKLPTREVLDDYAQNLELLLAPTIGRSLTWLDGQVLPQPADTPDTVDTGVGSLLGLSDDEPAHASLQRELRFHMLSRPQLFPLVEAVQTGDNPSGLRAALLQSGQLSTALHDYLRAAQANVAPRALVDATHRPTHPAVSIPDPIRRRLRIYAFDPSLGTSLKTANYNRINLDVRWENVLPGPVGEYLEVIDVDPASAQTYAPVDLNDLRVLARDGLDPSEGSPQFHQEMVYAVAMTTIAHFERALGRPAFWATTPYQDASGKWHREPFNQRLRIYPHALRARNAYYSPDKRALLFGYFRSPGLGGEPIGPMVFTCLSYDIIAHETTHALLDGMYRRYIDATNPDVLAFHEAFADIVALFQHFTHPDVVRVAIDETRGDLEADTPLGKLAMQFGEATGRRGALRSAIVQRNDDDIWTRIKPNAELLQTKAYQASAHLRGSILVVAVFDAFLQIYKRRARPLIRLATGGSGVLAPGDLPAYLVTALADEAAKAAEHVLTICIRALDYLPPVDITFGDYLRAIITADFDVVENDPLGYRIAFSEAFRAWGIYPEGITTVTPDSLRWEEPSVEAADFRLSQQMRDVMNNLLMNWRFTHGRADMHTVTADAKARLHPLFKQHPALAAEAGIDLAQSFEVHTLRPASAIGPDNDINQFVVVTLTQKRHRNTEQEFRTGSTILFNLRDGQIRYIIHKRERADDRGKTIAEYRARRNALVKERDPYALTVQQGEPFALVHLTGSI
jgi:quinol monooxygenase YgiN